MEERNKKTELLVGMFLFVGLALLALLILQFGSVKEIFKTTYEVTVPFPDGTGIKEGTPVMLGGSKIGNVPRKPALNADFNGVVIPLEIYATVKIPADSKFSIGTAGLLGDSYIEIRTTGLATTDYIPHGAVLTKENVTSSGGLGGLQDTAQNIGKKVDVAIEDIRAAVADLRLSLKRVNEGALSEKSGEDLKSILSHFNATITRVDERMLGEETTAQVREAVASFKDAANSLETSIKKLDPAVAKVESVVTRADAVMVSADSAMKSIDASSGAIGKVANDLRKGNGLLPALIYDASLKSEFSQLITNLRQRGILFYKDKPSEVVPPAKPPVGSSRRNR